MGSQIDRVWCFFITMWKAIKRLLINDNNIVLLSFVMFLYFLMNCHWKKIGVMCILQCRATAVGCVYKCARIFPSVHWRLKTISVVSCFSHVVGLVCLESLPPRSDLSILMHLYKDCILVHCTHTPVYHIYLSNDFSSHPAHLPPTPTPFPHCGVPQLQKLKVPSAENPKS